MEDSVKVDGWSHSQSQNCRSQALGSCANDSKLPSTPQSSYLYSGDTAPAPQRRDAETSQGLQGTRNRGPVETFTHVNCLTRCQGGKDAEDTGEGPAMAQTSLQGLWRL